MWLQHEAGFRVLKYWELKFSVFSCDFQIMFFYWLVVS
jgi:hypothetical protein